MSDRKSRRRQQPSIPVLGRDFAMEIEKAVVPDPYEQGALLEVRKNRRVHPLDYEHHNSRIDDAQKTAGDAFLLRYEAAEVGGAGAIDYGKTKVDTSLTYTGLSDRQLWGHSQLAAIRKSIGRRRFDILIHVIGRRTPIHDFAAQLGRASPPSWRTIQQARRAFVLSLDALVDHFGAMTGKEKVPISSFHVERWSYRKENHLDRREQISANRSSSQDL